MTQRQPLTGGLNCLLGLHAWSGWDRMDRSLFHPVRWVRECLSCGEREWRDRPPMGWCGSIDDDHNWEGSWVFPLLRQAIGRDGGPVTQHYKRCRRCGGENVLFSGRRVEG